MWQNCLADTRLIDLHDANNIQNLNQSKEFTIAAAGTRSHNLNCILTALFPIEEGYVVVVRDRVAHQQPADAADIMVKHLRPDKTLPIIFTIEDKRAQRQVNKRHWDQAAAQLEGYFTIERQSETGESATRTLHGAVAIGMLVEF
ncbi:hypothetical protein OIDMADRAFT_34546 [Oidiodendron maius Zn]|uniref:Uncharacterized protein n=1 Tax=Oidiodendron maius (strain Zn) TaxID=913774 RepID=A0A0C3GG71_OIDMZ|nr:hypothetical protein OIDMADRAFT_34546 [Oidiodendron maius Zn]